MAEQTITVTVQVPEVKCSTEGCTSTGVTRLAAAGKLPDGTVVATKVDPPEGWTVRQHGLRRKYFCPSHGG